MEYAEGEWVPNAETGELEWHSAEGDVVTAEEWAGEERAAGEAAVADGGGRGVAEAEVAAEPRRVEEAAEAAAEAAEVDEAVEVAEAVEALEAVGAQPSRPSTAPTPAADDVELARRREPLRTCVGCRRRAPQVELVRIARTLDGGLVVDRAAPGRGAWLCAGQPACLEAAERRKAFDRAFRAPVAPAAVARLRAAAVR